MLVEYQSCNIQILEKWIIAGQWLGRFEPLLFPRNTRLFGGRKKGTKAQTPLKWALSIIKLKAN
jgi:hypothetical protein